jgi:hypothetical protein
MRSSTLLTTLVTTAVASPLASYGLPPITLGGEVRTANSTGKYIIDKQTLIPGGSPITIYNNAAPTPPPPGGPHRQKSTGSGRDKGQGYPTLTIAGKECTADSEGRYNVGPQTLIPDGPPITVEGTPYSLFPSATAIMVGGSKYPAGNYKDHPAVPTPATTLMPQRQAKRMNVAAPMTPPLLTIAGQVCTADSQGAYTIGSQTLRPAGPPITVAGTPLSLFPSATAILIDGYKSLINLGKAAATPTPQVQGPQYHNNVAPTPAPLGQCQPQQNNVDNSNPYPILTIAGQTCTADIEGNYKVGAQNLIPGGHVITVSNMRFSLFPSATALMVDGSKIPITNCNAAETPMPTPPPAMRGQQKNAGGNRGNPYPPLTIAGQICNADSEGRYTFGTQTLTPGGPAIVVGGTPFSLFRSATALMVDGIVTPIQQQATPVPTSVQQQQVEYRRRRAH